MSFLSGSPFTGSSYLAQAGSPFARGQSSRYYSDPAPRLSYQDYDQQVDEQDPFYGSNATHDSYPATSSTFQEGIADSLAQGDFDANDLPPGSVLIEEETTSQYDIDGQEVAGASETTRTLQAPDGSYVRTRTVTDDQGRSATRVEAFDGASGASVRRASASLSGPSTALSRRSVPVLSVPSDRVSQRLAYASAPSLSRSLYPSASSYPSALVLQRSASRNTPSAVDNSTFGQWSNVQDVEWRGEQAPASNVTVRSLSPVTIDGSNGLSRQATVNLLSARALQGDVQASNALSLLSRGASALQTHGDNSDAVFAVLDPSVVLSPEVADIALEHAFVDSLDEQELGEFLGQLFTLYANDLGMKLGTRLVESIRRLIARDIEKHVTGRATAQSASVGTDLEFHRFLRSLPPSDLLSVARSIPIEGPETLLQRPAVSVRTSDVVRGTMPLPPTNAPLGVTLLKLQNGTLPFQAGPASAAYSMRVINDLPATPSVLSRTPTSSYRSPTVTVPRTLSRPSDVAQSQLESRIEQVTRELADIQTAINTPASQLTSTPQSFSQEFSQQVAPQVPFRSGVASTAAPLAILTPDGSIIQPNGTILSSVGIPQQPQSVFSALASRRPSGILFPTII